ncbi:MAG: tRNA preQ1(34) S-adenosylmethionine ribosyltransferase-isomerase QueA [Treponema sp.]|nr:tRNA preQ1(34) S-adenosylmethionine ribosyltransferase-isomerase QueA [Treponema sp.]
MKTSDFDFDLPGYLIAQTPPMERGSSRLMLVDRSSGKTARAKILDLSEILCGKNFLNDEGQKPLLIFNDTKVRKARLIGKSCKSGALIEFLLTEKIESGVGSRGEETGFDARWAGNEWKVITKHTGRRKRGDIFIFYDNKNNEINRAIISGRVDIYLLIIFEKPVDEDFFENYGHVPLPSYIKRSDNAFDAERYQTIYARNAGSAAAPTAGLHFTKEILESLNENGVESAFVTLHVGLGTFLPVRSENIEDHIMHEEQFIITDNNADIIENAARQKRKIIAIGTTSLRSLESAVNIKENSAAIMDLNDHEKSSGIYLKRGWQKTSIYIYPGYKFKIVDALFTNFHTPLSTLLMLVCAFAGKDLILDCYKEAVREGYRFFSYGDAMLIY